jgi:hypothetical protein
VVEQGEWMRVSGVLNAKEGSVGIPLFGVVWVLAQEYL